jgi:hypothetical protein
MRQCVLQHCFFWVNWVNGWINILPLSVSLSSSLILLNYSSIITPDFIEPVLHCVLRSINDPSLAVAASNSLEAITSICRDHLKSHFDILLQVVSALVTLPIPTETAVRVVKGVTKVCSRLPDHQISDALHQLCKIHVDELTRIAQVIYLLVSLITDDNRQIFVNFGNFSIKVGKSVENRRQN